MQQENVAHCNRGGSWKLEEGVGSWRIDVPASIGFYEFMQCPSDETHSVCK